MTVQRKNLFFFSVGTIMTLFIVFGQACGELTSPSSTEEKANSSAAEAGNGDYYTGISDELSKSVSTMSEEFFAQSFQQEDVVESPGVGESGACESLAAAMCSNGIKRVEYSGCRVGSLRTILTGYAQLEFTDNQCARGEDGQGVLKTYDLSFVNRFDQELLLSSEFHYDYRGNQIGGGERIRTTANGYVTETLGKRSILTTPRLDVVFDHSTRSLIPTRLRRLGPDTTEVLIGSTEVIDNLNRWTAQYVVVGLEMSRQCCHPIRGSMAVRYLGRVTGSGVITYSGCGSATLNINNQNYDLQLNSCEEE